MAPPPSNPARRRPSSAAGSVPPARPRRSSAQVPVAKPAPKGAKLVCLAGPPSGSEYVLAGDEVVVGRAAETGALKVVLSAGKTSLNGRVAVLAGATA